MLLSFLACFTSNFGVKRSRDASYPYRAKGAALPFGTICAIWMVIGDIAREKIGAQKCSTMLATMNI